MRTLHLKILLRAALLVAIVASTALLVDYLSTAGPSFCGVGSGCAQVRASAFSHVFGIPLPIFGLAGFAILFLGASWARSREHFRWLAVACGLGAAGAIALIGLMVFVIKAVCPWCMGVDLGAIVAALVAFVLARREPDVEPNGPRWLWTGTAVAAAVITLLWGRDPEYKPPPPDVAALQVPGKVTLVVFTDFECPFCRALHPVIDELAKQSPETIAVRLVMVPLPIHLGAEPTARAYLCSDEAHQKALAHEFYSIAYDELTNETAQKVADGAGVSLEKLVERLNNGDQSAIDQFKRVLETSVTEKALGAAAKVGLDREAVKACMADPQTRARLDEQVEMFRRVKLDGLPSTYVGNYLVQGADEPMLRSAVNATIAGGGLSVRWMLLIIGGMAVAVAVLNLSQRAAKAADSGAAGLEDAAEAMPGDDAARGSSNGAAAATPARRRRNSERPATHGGAKRKGRTSRRPPAHREDTESGPAGTAEEDVPDPNDKDEPPR